MTVGVDTANARFTVSVVSAMSYDQLPDRLTVPADNSPNKVGVDPVHVKVAFSLALSLSVPFSFCGLFATVSFSDHVPTSESELDPSVIALLPAKAMLKLPSVVLVSPKVRFAASLISKSAVLGVGSLTAKNPFSEMMPELVVSAQLL